MIFIRIVQSKYSRLLTLSAVLFSFLAEPVFGGDNGICFRGQRSQSCQTFWITEFGYYRVLHRDSIHQPDREGNWYLTGDIGLMANMNKKYSIGVTGFFGGVEDGSRFGVKPRFRVWVQDKIRIELSPGVLLSGGDNSYDPQFPDFTGHVAINFADFGALTLQLDLIPYEKSLRVGPGRGRLLKTGTDISLYGGVKFGSYLGILGGFVTLILYGIELSQIQLD